MVTTRNNVIRIVIFAIVMPLLYALPLIGSSSFINFANAADPAISFSGKITANNDPINDVSVSVFNKYNGQSSTAKSGTSGEFTVSIYEGYNYFQIELPRSTQTQYLATNFYVVVKNGEISTVKKSTGESIDVVSNVYQITLTAPNVTGKLTVGGVGVEGYVQAAFDVSKGQIVNFESVGPNSNGDYGIKLSPGIYDLYIRPYNQASAVVNCVVPSSGVVTCNATLPEKNLFFNILNQSGTLLKSNVYSYIIDKRIGYYSYISSNTETGLFETAMPDGSFELIVRSNDPDQDGQPRTFEFSVKNGVVSDLVDTLNEEKVLKTSSPFNLRLATSNFIGVVKANGTIQSNSWSYAYQNKFWQYSISDSNGKIKFSLPNGENKIYLEPSSSDTQSVSSNFIVKVESGLVTSVTDSSGTAITASGSEYELNLGTPNIKGKLTKNGVGVPGYIQVIWNTVTNKWVDFQGRKPSGAGDFGILLPSGNFDIAAQPNEGVLGVRNCQAEAGVIKTCNFEFPSDNFKVELKNYSGVKVSKNISILLSPTTVTGDDLKTHTFPYRFESSMPQDGNGLFSASLLDGGYFMRIDTSDSLGIGVSRSFDLQVESGTVTSLIDKETAETLTVSSSPIQITFLEPNLKLKVKANGASAPGLWYWGYSLTKGGSEKLDGYTDINGAITKNLKNGTYEFYINPTGQEDPIVVREKLRVTIDSGTVTSILNGNSDSVTASAGIHEVSLPVANVTGSVTVNGSTNYTSYHYPAGIYDLDNNRWVETLATIRNTSFGAKLPLGRFAIMTNVNPVGLITTECIVTSTTSNTCNIDRPNHNFIFKIQDPNGTDLLRNVSASINLEINGYGGTGIGSNVGDGGLFKASLKHLANMNFKVNVYSDKGAQEGTPKTYQITMSGDTVTAVSDLTNGASVTKDINGVWPLKLGQPNIAGSVVETGTAGVQIPNTLVRAIGPEQVWLWTDRTGYFSTTVNTDGTYTVWAQAPENDMTKADSARTKVTIANGVGRTDLQFKLRTPNVKGVVSGPKGNSSYNYIQVFKKDDNGDYQYLSETVNSNRPTDSKGNFAFYLEPGTYKFFAQNDENFAGGGSTYSTECVVVDVSVIKNCDFSLQSFNLKINLKSISGSAYRDAWTYFSWMSNGSLDEIAPSQTWAHSSPNEQGQISFALGNGEWRGRVDIFGTGNESPMELIAKVEGGVVTSLKDIDGITYTKDSSTGVFDIQLAGSNLTGSITANGKSISYGAWVNVVKSVDDYIEYAGGKWTSAGKFAIKVKPGTYVIEVIPYPNEALNASTPVRTKLSQCNVPETGNVTCNVALTTGNLFGEVITPAGDVVNYAGAYIYKMVTDTKGYSYESWDQGLNIQDGRFNALIDNGTYRLWVGPDWKSSGKYTSRTYEIVVNSNVVQSVTDLTLNQTISKVGDKYQFKLGSPSLTGKVFMPAPSAETIPGVSISIQNVSSGEYLWNKQGWTNESGEFSISLPDGTYDLVARTWGSGYTFTNSDKTRVTINNSSSVVDVEIRMKSPNLTGRVVTPTSSTTGVSNVSVNGWFGDQYFYATTNADGYFGAYIDSSTVSCPTNCSINIWPNSFGKYVSKTHSISAVGDVGNLALGQVNTKVNIYTPTNGGVGIPNKWSWVLVTEMQVGNNTVISSYGVSANELGIAGLDLVNGHHYQITAYPNWEYYAQYSPKTVDIPSYDSTANATISITFDSPNITLVIQDKDQNPNAWGWFEIQKLNGAAYDYFYDGYVNEIGRGALYLAAGDYKMHIYPGKGAGVEAEILFSVDANGSMTSSDSNVTINSNNVAIFRLATGNVSGKVFASNGTTALANIPVAAIKNSDSSTVVSTVTRKDGSYELNLNVTFDWTIKAINPDDLKTGSVAIGATSPSNAILTNKNITLSTS